MSGIAPPGETLSVRIGKQFDRESAGFALHAEFAVPVGLTILFGPSGAGKTTLLDCVAGLVAPDEGRITIGNAVLFDSPSHINVPPNRRFARLSIAVACAVSTHERGTECELRRGSSQP